ncbi:MAG TPA: carbohydrate porin [Prolixibacteraceae bacterium]|nr:carbohydrate porin [Prolixibacteraceae bacterium]
MNKKYLKKGFVMLMILNTRYGFSQNTDALKSQAWQLNASYKGDFVTNFRGGIKTGSTYLGLADLSLNFNTEKAGLWKGGEFLVHGANSHGGEPSASLIGDFQFVSNIEAGNHTFLYELWYKQTIWNVTATLGLQDLNAEFAGSDVASLFLNSSFGIHSVIADNILAPIFPLTSPGITLNWEASGKLSLKTAIYKGCPIDFDANTYNLNWNLNYLRGILWVAESQYSWTGNEEKDNELKAGVFFHQHCPESDVVNSETGNTLTHDYGFYLVGDHQITSSGENGQGLNVFYQLGVSPRNDNFGYIGAGFSYTGLLSKSGSDVLGLAMARGMLTDERGRDETSFELTYKTQITDQIYLQPDLQYVVHPGGTDVQLKNATVGMVRLGLEF